MKIEIVPPYSLAYIRQTGPYGAGNVQTMERLKTFAASNNSLDDEAIILGIAQDDPSKTKPEDCRYDTCLVVSADFRINDESVSRGALCGGKYAVFVVEHTAEAVQKAWNEILPELMSGGYRIDGAKSIFERYAARMIMNHQCEICVPVS